jgi:hypothetical protein
MTTIRQLVAGSGGRISMSNPSADYPETVEEVIDDNIKYRKGVVKTIRQFKAAKLWGSKTNQERLDGLKAIAVCLAPLYEIEVPTVTTDGIDLNATVRDTKMKDSGESTYTPSTHTITMRGNLSIITFLHEFGHALGKDERGACKWSINLFKKVFPAQYDKLNHDGHTLRRQRPNEDAIDRVLSE